MKFAEAFVEIRTDQKRLRADMANAEKVVRGGFGKITALAKNAGLAIAGFFGARALFNFGRSIIQAAAEADEAMSVIRQAIESTGGAAGKSADELDRFANQLQAVTKFSDEAVKEVQAIVLTFKNIRGDAFDRTTEAILDLATVMKTDAKSAALQMAKAMNDPVLGVTALSRAGVQFTDDQKDMIKALVNTGDVAAAQTLVLAEVEGQVLGLARAAGTSLAGQLAIASNSFADFKEEMGEGVVTGLKLNNVLEQLSGNLAEGGGLAKRAGENFGALFALIGKAFAGISNIFTDLTFMIDDVIAKTAIAIGKLRERFGLTESTRGRGRRQVERGEESLRVTEAAREFEERRRSGAIAREAKERAEREAAERKKVRERERREEKVAAEAQARAAILGGALARGKKQPGEKAGRFSTIASGALAGAADTLRGERDGLFSVTQLAPRDEGPTKSLQEQQLAAMEQIAENTREPAPAALR